MTTPLRCPFGRRDSIHLAMIVSAMALSACLTAQEKKQREDRVEQIKADASARLEQQEQQQEQAKQATITAEDEKQAKITAARAAALKEWLKKWVRDNEPYVRSLCSTDPGIEHRWTWENFKVAVSTDPQHASEARDTERPVIDCEALRIQKPAEFDPAAFMERLEAENTARSAWLASPVGKEYQQHLCSLAGAERQEALENALQQFGIFPREKVIDEAKSKSHGFAVLDCEELTVSALGYTWSNITFAESAS